MEKLKNILDPQKETKTVYMGPERRKRPTPAVSAYAFGKGRRYSVDSRVKDGGFVDLYSQRLAIMLLLFFFFTVVDSVSTLIYLDKGGKEMNPVAQWMIDQGDEFFILVKGVVSALCILFVMIHKNFRYSQIAIILGFTFYSTLTLYHIILQIKAL